MLPMIIANGIYLTNKIIMLSISNVFHCFLFPPVLYPQPLFFLSFSSCLFFSPFFTVSCVSNNSISSILKNAVFPFISPQQRLRMGELAVSWLKALILWSWPCSLPSPRLSFLIWNNNHVTCQVTWTPVRRALNIVTGQHLTFITN